MSEQHSNEQLIDLVVSPETAADQQLLLAALLKATGSKTPLFFEIIKPGFITLAFMSCITLLKSKG